MIASSCAACAAGMMRMAAEPTFRWLGRILSQFHLAFDDCTNVWQASRLPRAHLRWDRPICVGMFEPGAALVSVSIRDAAPMPVAPVVMSVDAMRAPAAAVVNRFAQWEMTRSKIGCRRSNSGMGAICSRAVSEPNRTSLPGNTLASSMPASRVRDDSSAYGTHIGDVEPTLG